MKKAAEHTLEYLLAFDGRRHWYEGGYFAKFEIRRVPADMTRPHGLKYSFTLHAPDGSRLIGFDNAHAIPPRGSRLKKRPPAVDHWHRTVADAGRRYAFKDAETLVDDFFDEIERILTERGVSFEVIADDDGS